MGANLVMQVFAGWTHVSDRAFRVLVRMAVTALDTPSKGQAAGIYHGGRELLAMSLRSQGGTDRTRYRSVAEAVAELTEAGAIEHLATGWAGQNAVYRLTLGRPESAIRGDGMGGSTAHPMGVLRDHPMDVPTGTKWMGPGHTPRNQEEPIGERGEEEGADLETASHPPRATADVSKPAPKKCPEHGLGGGLRPDGKPECTLCRVVGPKPSDPDPDPPPDRPARCDHTPLPGKDRCRICAPKPIAPVIRIDTRRPA